MRIGVVQTMLDFEEIIEKLRDILSTEKDGKVFDKDIAAALDITSVNFATMKKRDSVPFSNILDFCALKKYLLIGCYMAKIQVH